VAPLGSRAAGARRHGRRRRRPLDDAAWPTPGAGAAHARGACLPACNEACLHTLHLLALALRRDQGQKLSPHFPYFLLSVSRGK